MSNVELVIRGRKILGKNKEIIDKLWHQVFEKLFNVIYFRFYRNENELLDILCEWADNHKLVRIEKRNVVIFSKAFCTHRKHAGTRRSWREFGDVTFLMLFSQGSQRCGYVNTFQLKVGMKFLSIIKRLDYSQLDFYRRNLVKNVIKPHYELFMCDFLYYWMIEAVKPRVILEVPLSILWMNTHNMLDKWMFFLPSFSNSIQSIQGINIMLRNLFLTTGVNVNDVLRLAKPSLKKLLEDILNRGVEKVAKQLLSNGGYPEHCRDEQDEPEENEFIGTSLNSSIVIATEIYFKEEKLKKNIYYS